MIRMASMFITVFVAYSGGLAAAASDDAERHCVMVEYTDLIGTSLCRARQWAAYARGFHLWEVGRPTSVGVQVLAESGHPEYNLSDALWDHDTFGDFAVGLPNVRGSTHRVKLTVDASHLLTSGGWMLAAANGGFAGVDGVDALALTSTATRSMLARRRTPRARRTRSAASGMYRKTAWCIATRKSQRMLNDRVTSSTTNNISNHVLRNKSADILRHLESVCPILWAIPVPSIPSDAIYLVKALSLPGFLLVANE